MCALALYHASIYKQCQTLISFSYALCNLSFIALTVQEASVNCPGLSTPTNGTVSYRSQRVGHIARYACSTGYTLEGSSSRTCLAGGYWSGHQPNCLGKKTWGKSPGSLHKYCSSFYDIIKIPHRI